jgi:peptidoglycan biosynthesis protein MviN/MurJ (putative lipid II flippase)
MLILNRSFYAVQTNWTPTAIALGAVGLNAALDTVFYRFGIWGIPLATALVNVVAATTLFVMMRRRIGLEHVARTMGVVLRVTAAAVLAAAAAFLTWYGLDSWLGSSLLAQLVCVGAGLVVAALAYLGISRVLGLRELEALLLLRARRDTPPE